MACAVNKLSNKGAEELRAIASIVEQQRLEKRRQYQQAITLILLSYRYSEESAFHVLPLEMIHIIIQFVLNDMPAASFDVFCDIHV